MVGYTLQKSGQIYEDLRHSWYFRVWALLWLFLVVFWFVGMGILAHRSLDSSKHSYLNSYLKVDHTLEFPPFHFRLGDPKAINNQTILCAWGHALSTPLGIIRCACPGPFCGNDTSHCFSVNTTGVASLLSGSQYQDGLYTSGGQSSRIQCNFTTQSSESDGNELMAFEIEADQDGANSYASMWFLPNNNTWILLTKNLIDGVAYWDRSMFYHSAQMNTPQGPPPLSLLYCVTVIIDTNLVRKSKPWDFYIGWQAVADIGGWAFMLVVLHRVAMGLIGVVLENDSVFLGGASRYGQAEAEPINRH